VSWGRGGYDVGMGAVTTKLLTFEEFERLPEQDDVGKCELLEGELIAMPPGDLEHSRFAKLIYHLLFNALEAAHARGEAADLGEVFLEAGYKLSARNYVVPDVSITHAAQAHAKYLMSAPAIAIEVVSESNTAREMEKKVMLYFRYGAREVWRVYSDPVHIVVHFADGSRTIQEGSVTTPLLPGFELPLTTLEGLIEKS
jgi:Uma2 family endonuclease